MAQRNDQVFQLSLTEIAFTVAFILLLLLGYLVFKEQAARLAAEAELAKVQTAESAAAALNTAKNTLAAALQGAGAANPDAVITKLVADDNLRVERDRLKEEVEDLDAKLTALMELQNKIEKVAMSSRPDIIKAEIDGALALQEQVRSAIEKHFVDDTKPTPQVVPKAPAASPLPGVSIPNQRQSSSAVKALGPASSAIASNSASNPATIQKLPEEQRTKVILERVKQAIVATSELRKQLRIQLGQDLKPGQEAQKVQELVFAAKSYGDLARSGSSPEVVKRENSDLRGQVAFLKNRLDARGGRDFPPCWADETGKVEFLFSIEMRSDSFVVTPAWPPKREGAARALPGIAEALASAHSTQSFVSSIQGVFNWSKKQDPECRHYVLLKSAIADAIQSDRARLMVENYFYKVEARR